MKKNWIFGLGEPITMVALENGQDLDAALGRIEALGFTVYREWMHTRGAENSAEVKKEAFEAYTKVLGSRPVLRCRILAFYVPAACDAQRKCVCDELSMMPNRKICQSFAIA